jgi:hypothetical protein
VLKVLGEAQGVADGRAQAGVAEVLGLVTGHEDPLQGSVDLRVVAELLREVAEAKSRPGRLRAGG